MSWDINKKKSRRAKKSIKPFGSDAQTGERTVFGSNSISDELEENLSVDFERGWGIVPQDAPPTRQDFNGWHVLQTHYLHHTCFNKCLSGIVIKHTL